MSSVEAGARELSISTEQSRTNGVVVAVRDSGPGIDPEHLERVFEAFYTTKSERNRDGPVDLPVHHRCSWRPAVGRCERAQRRDIPVHRAQCGKGAHDFSSAVSPDRRAARRHRYQMLLINRLGKVTNDSVVQGAGPNDVIGVCSNEDRRNGVPRSDEVAVELDSGHGGHMHVSDQAGGFGGDEEMRGNRLPTRKPRRCIPATLRSLLMESRKNRSSSTTETNDFLAISGPIVAIVTIMRGAPACGPDNLHTEPRRGNAGARKPWFMPRVKRWAVHAHRGDYI